MSLSHTVTETSNHETFECYIINNWMDLSANGVAMIVIESLITKRRVNIYKDDYIDITKEWDYYAACTVDEHATLLKILNPPEDVQRNVNVKTSIMTYNMSLTYDEMLHCYNMAQQNGWVHDIDDIDYPVDELQPVFAKIRSGHLKVTT